MGTVHSDAVAPQPFDAPAWPPGADLTPLSRDEGAGAPTGLLGLPAGAAGPVDAP